MNCINECRLLHPALTFDDISRDSQCKNIKFKRAFQFLRILLLRRVYGIDAQPRPNIRRAVSKREFDVFLGGSCNPTTWRYEQAIPYFQSRSISYYNPQVANWTPDLIEVERHAKEEAPLLFFVIDHNTRSLAAIAEVCYLAARGRKIIVVMNLMPDDKFQTKFIQEKNSVNKIDDEYDYENACEARRLLKILLQTMNIPIFDNVRIALECSAFVLESTKDNRINWNDEGINHSSSSSLSPFFRSIHFTTDAHFHHTKTQRSSITNESDDDGYDSLESLSQSSTDFRPCLSDQQNDNNSSGFYLSYLISNRMKIIFNICTYPFRWLTKIFFREELVHSNSSTYLFDIYIAYGDYDEHWLNTCALPLLDEINVTYTKRQMNYDNEQIDILCDIHIRKQTRLLYYLINNNERLSQLTTELAFLIGERKYHIIVYLQSTINENCENILTKNERQDIERSRKYLEDLAKKENILLYQSREQSWQHVLTVFLHD